MKEVISERAKIREMDAQECEDWRDCSLRFIWNEYLEEMAELVSKQYLQLTGNPLF